MFEARGAPAPGAERIVGKMRAAIVFWTRSATAQTPVLPRECYAEVAELSHLGGADWGLVAPLELQPGGDGREQQWGRITTHSSLPGGETDFSICDLRNRIPVQGCLLYTSPSPRDS